MGAGGMYGGGAEAGTVGAPGAGARKPQLGQKASSADGADTVVPQRGQRSITIEVTYPPRPPILAAGFSAGDPMAEPHLALIPGADPRRHTRPETQRWVRASTKAENPP